MDQTVKAALLAALDADPGNADVRVLLIEQLVGAGQSDEALAIARAGLALQPAQTGILGAAAGAAGAAGLHEEATGYTTLLNALQQAQPTEQIPPPEPDVATALTHPTSVAPGDRSDVVSSRPRDGASVDGDTSSPDSVDELLAIWDEHDAPEDPDIGELVATDVTLRDVGGMVDVKQRLTASFLMPMQNPELRATFGKSMRGGLLLWGPPGCGKTFIARAVAGELGARFYHVGLSDVLDMWIGSSERNVTQLFDVARRNSPCVLFLDEVDALAQKRTQLRSSGAAMRGVVNQLLQEMDGASTDNEGVFVLAATNHPWDVDSALLRPGRLDRQLLVLPPDREARESILELHLRGKPTDRLDLAKVAKSTDGLTGADLALVCDQATEYAMTDSIAAGRVRSITMRDLAKAVKSVRPSHGPWIESAKNYALYNNEDGRYDDLLAWMKRRSR